MRTRALALAVMATLLVAGGASAQARTTHRVKGSVQVVPVSVSGTLPNLTIGVAGTLSTKPYGRGAIVGRARYTGSSAPNVFKFAGSFTAFLAKGSLSGTLKGTATLATATNLVTFGSVKVRRGTGRYRGATGKLRFRGSTILPTQPIAPPFSAPRVKLSGTLTY